MNKVKDSSTRNKFLVISFITHLFILLVYTITYFFFLRSLINHTYNNIFNEAYFTEQDRLNEIAVIIAVLFILYLISRIVLIISFCMWVFRTYNNLILIEKKSMNYKNPWSAVGVLFIPIINLFFLFKVVAELWYETQRKAYGYKKIKNNTIVVLWSATFIISLIFFTFARFQGINMVSFDYVQNAEILRNLNIFTFANFGLVISGVFGIIMMRKFSKYEKDMIRTVSENTDELTYDELQIG